MSEPRQKPGQSKQDYATPAEFIDAVVKRFGPLAWDLAASAENAKAPRFYTEADNSLVQPWSHAIGNLWLNPPFGDIEPWARKASEYRGFGSILMLTPASVGSNWFLRHVHGKAYVLALNPRMSFDGVNVFPKDCMLSVFNGPDADFDVWRWKGADVGRVAA